MVNIGWRPEKENTIEVRKLNSKTDKTNQEFRSRSSALAKFHHTTNILFLDGAQ